MIPPRAPRPPDSLDPARRFFFFFFLHVLMEKKLHILKIYTRTRPSARLGSSGVEYLPPFSTDHYTPHLLLQVFKEGRSTQGKKKKRFADVTNNRS